MVVSLANKGTLQRLLQLPQWRLFIGQPAGRTATVTIRQWLIAEILRQNTALHEDMILPAGPSLDPVLVSSAAHLRVCMQLSVVCLLA